MGSTYRNSTLRGDEWIRILNIRYGQQDQKSSSYAKDGKSSGLDED